MEYLPKEIHDKIVKYLTPLERLPLSTLSEYWAKVSFERCSKIALIKSTAPTNFWDSSLSASLKRRLRSFTVFVLYDTKKLASCIRQVSKATNITSLFLLNFTENLPLEDSCINLEERGKQNNPRRLSSCLDQLTSLLLHNCCLEARHVYELISETKSLISMEIINVVTDIDGKRLVYDYGDFVNAIVENNRMLKQLSIIDFNNIYAGIAMEKIGTLETVHLHNLQEQQCAKKIINYIFNSYALWPISSLCLSQSLRCLTVSPACEVILYENMPHFENLCDLRLYAIESNVVQKLGGQVQFPNLTALTLKFFVYFPRIEDLNCVFTQNNRLKVLNVDAKYTTATSFQVLSSRYKDLKFLFVRYAEILNTDALQAICSMKYLKYIVWLDHLPRYTCSSCCTKRIDEQLCFIINSLPHLRVLHILYTNIESLPFTKDAIMFVASRNPKEHYFIDVRGIHGINVANIHNIRDSKFADYFSLWNYQTNCMSFFDYEAITWEI